MTELPNPFICASNSCGVVEAHEDMPIGLRGLTDAGCKWPLSRWEGETTPAAGLDASPQDHRFTLDEAAFMDAIEPAPLFLSDPRPEYLDAIPDAVLAVLAGY